MFISILGLNAQNWIQSTVIKGSNIEPKYSVVDNAGNIYIYSTFTDTVYTFNNLKSYGVRDMILKKINAQGEVLWHNHIGSTKNDNAGGITKDENNNIYILGNYFGNCRFTLNDSIINTGNGDVFLAKYNPDGTFLWAKRICSATTNQGATDLKFDGSNKLVTTGYYTDSLIVGIDPANSDTLLANGYTANFIAVFDVDGNLQWSKRILGTYNLSRIIKTDISQNGYYFGGYFQGSMYFDVGTITSYSPAAYDAYIYKTDFSGNGQWVRRIRGQNNENFRTLTTDEFDNVYILGNYSSPTIFVDSTETITKTYTGNSGGFDTFVGKYNRSGILQWFLRKGSSAKDIYNDFVVRNNVIFATGYFTNQIIFNNDTLKTSSSTNSDAFVAAFNEIGDPISGVSIVGTGNYEDAGTIVNMDANSRAYVSGYYRSQQIQIGSQTYTSSNVNKSDLFFAIYQQSFQAVITNEQMVSCNGLSDGMLTVTPYFGRPPYTYSWSHNTSLNNPVADNLPAGTYTVTITDANSTQAIKTAEVTQPQVLAINDLTTPVSCYNGSDGAIDVTVIGGTQVAGYNYFWTTLNGSGIVPLGQDQSGLTDGTYSLSVKDDNNCEASKDIVVTQPARFSYDGTVVTDIFIPPGSNGSINLTVTGSNSPYTYAWTGPSGSGFTASSEDIANLSAVGLYNLTVTDSKSCTADTSIAVIDNFTMVAQVTAKTDVLCFGADDGTATVTVYNSTATPFTYQWSDGVTLTDIATRTNMPSGNYSVLVTDAALNTSRATIKINAPPAALNLLLDPQDLHCYQDSSGVIDLTVTGGSTPYSFSWSNTYTGEDLVNVAAGTYTVTVTDANGCEAIGSQNLIEPNAIALDISLSGEILCYGGNNVSATANASGGFGSFSYLWDDPGTQVTKTANELSAGTYHVTVTDENGCYETGSTLITQPDSLSLEVDVNNPCPGGTDGSLIADASGGTGPYDYEWSNDVYERINTDLAAGTYGLKVTDHNSCNIEREFTLTNLDTVKVALVEVTPPTCDGPSNGMISIYATGGTGVYEYSADDGLNFVSDSAIGSLAEGTYLVVVRDDRECSSEAYPVVLIISETCALVVYDAFSPNADGKNDVWNIGNISGFPSCSVKIYNTWGTLVFSSNGYGTPWDGKHDGKDLPSGTYYYVIDPGDGSGAITGAVSLVY